MVNSRILFWAFTLAGLSSLATPAAAAGWGLGVRYAGYSTGGVNGQGDRDISLGGTTTIPGVGSNIPVTTAGGITEAKIKSDKIASFGVYIMTPIGLSLGVTQTTDTATKAWNTKTALATSVNATGTAIKQWAPTGTQLLEEDMKTTVDYLDIAYTLRTLLGLTVGVGIPVASSNSINVKYGPEATALVAADTGITPSTETLKVKGRSGYAVFADFVFGIGPVDITIGARREQAAGTVDISQSPLHLLAGTNSMTSSSTITMVNVGVGMHL